MRETEKVKVRKGEAIKAKEKQRETLKDNPKCTFLGEKSVFLLKAKKGKEKAKKK